MKNIKILTVGAILLTIIACGKKQGGTPSGGKGGPGRPGGKSSITAVKTTSVEYKKISSEILGNAELDSQNLVELTAPAGEVEKIYVNNGDKVKAGDLIMSLSDDDIEQNYLSAKASLMSAEASYNEKKSFEELNVKNSLSSAESTYKQAKETYEKALRGSNKKEIAIQEANTASAREALKQAEFNYDKYKELYEKELISESEFITYETTYKQAKASYDSAKNTLELAIDGTDEEDIRSYKAAYDSAEASYLYANEQVEGESWKYSIKQAEASYLSAKASFKQAEEELKDLEVKAKIDGVVAGIVVKRFEKTSGETQVLATVIDESKIEVIVGLSAEEISKLDEEKETIVFIEDVDLTYKGKIVSINPIAEDSTNKFKVKIYVENDGYLKKGMFADVTLFEKTKNCLVVPKESVVIKNLYSYIFTVENEKSKRIRVETGISDDDYIQVISDSVKEGDKVVIEGQFLLQDNESIKEVE